MIINSRITCENIFLRTLIKNDATLSYLDWLLNPEINSFLEARFFPPINVSDLAAFIDRSNSSSDSLLLGIFLQEKNCHIGNIKLGPIDFNHKVAEIGFLIGDKKHWGKGYASKAIITLADYAFKELKLSKLTAGCYAGNEGSRRALLKANFVEEGRRISQWVMADSRQDGIMMGLINPVLTSPDQVKPKKGH
jgi:RimJ/RimL family protein N-acetyltransferase